jgi:peptide/nickel transport system permease protein
VRTLVRLLTLLLAGTLLETALVLYAPGYEFDEQSLDTRLSAATQEQRLQERAASRPLDRAYLHTLNAWIHGDLGLSRQFQRPVRELLAERAPATLQTLATGLGLAWTLGITLAIATARNPLASRIALVGSTALLCLPAAGVGLALLLLTGGRGQFAGIALALVLAPKIHQTTRELLRAQKHAPYLLLARAKGLSDASILLRHAIPVIAPPLLAWAGVSVALAFSAAVPLEVVFDSPGIGQLALQAAMARDLPLLSAITLLLALITVLVTPNTARRGA